jgi:hypothetical protein
MFSKKRSELSGHPNNIRNSVCFPAKLPCRRVVEGNYNNIKIIRYLYYVVSRSALVDSHYKKNF